jgi:hypothetical protein
MTDMSLPIAAAARRRAAPPETSFVLAPDARWDCTILSTHAIQTDAVFADSLAKIAFVSSVSAIKAIEKRNRGAGSVLAGCAVTKS